MATKETVAAEAAENDKPQDVTLEEFCVVLSQTDRRVEVIGAFYSTEKRAGHIKDLSATFKSRFDEFLNKATD